MSMLIILFISQLKTLISFNVRNVVNCVVFSFPCFLAFVVRKSEIFPKVNTNFSRSKRFNFQRRSSLPLKKCELHLCSVFFCDTRNWDYHNALLFSIDLSTFSYFIILIKNKTGELIRATLDRRMQKSLRS